MEEYLVHLIGMVLGLLFGGAAGYLIGKWKTASSAEANPEMDQLRVDFKTLEHEKIELSARVTNLSENKEMLITESEQLREKNQTYFREIGEKSSTIEHLKQRLEQEKAEIEKLNEQFRKEFENLASKILKSSTDDFSKTGVEKMESILKPFKEEISTFRQKIDQNREKQIQENVSLKEQITGLTKLNQQMTEEASRLVNALKGQSKTRGNWGEMILESILEQSGLRKGEQYLVQETVKDEHGNMLRPDVVVKLPGEKNIIIDSKLSLVAYEQFVNSEEETEKAVQLKSHINSMKNHINDLWKKNYASLYGISSPDFTLMFIPLDGAFQAAVESDSSIYQEALSKSIAIVTPATLLATLRIVDNIWRVEARNQNSLEIAELGGKLYDKFVGFVEDLREIEKHIKKTDESYQSAFKKLSSGRGNAMGIAEKMRELGVETRKRLAYEEESES